MLAHEPPESDLSRQKATLFCPDCGHGSDIDGDWLVSETGGGRSYACPKCGRTVTSRRL